MFPGLTLNIKVPWPYSSQCF